MNATALIITADAMLSGGRGLLTTDESTDTCNKRLMAAGIPATADTSGVWRELLVTAPGLGESISGTILFDETIRQGTASGTRFVDVLSQAGILVGIKVDSGAKPLALHAGETVVRMASPDLDRLDAPQVKACRSIKVSAGEFGA